MKVQLPSGTVVQAYGLSGFISTNEDDVPDWALYLDKGWRKRSIEWPHRFVDWPDFELPADEIDAFEAIVEAWHRAVNGELVDIACDGGTGRTGTVLACLSVLAGIPREQAIDWVQSHYHRWAVESPELQRPLIVRFANWAASREEGA